MIMKRTKAVTKTKLFIEELERPASAASNGNVTTLAIGEESLFGGKKMVTTLAIGEEA
ncbi:MAG: hypothetical protein HZB26_22235 [Candidatus Hydrogenedentes bacterium]|nr:hypothetical protein [Candidatus Hydrogenedentota bacterium]